MKRLAMSLIALWLVPGVARGGLRETVHNLSPGGVGRQQIGGGGAAAADDGGDLCIFCHTPHSAEGRRGLWNRALKPMTYKLYDSSTTEAVLQQPTGSSRLCLSCHDGMIAVGALKQHGDSTLGKLTGAAVLGTDLSDDHPISFVYDQALATRRGELAAPSTLKDAVRLDETGQMQCTSCHDAHIEQHPKFLVTDPSHSRLCITCHRLPHWDESAHATSSANAPSADPLEHATVAETGCSSCHRSHAAEHPEWLLAASNEEGVCLTCHDGSVAAKDLRREATKYSAHRVDVYTDIHDPAENPKTMAEHVECVDCHNSHQVGAPSIEGQLPRALAGASGVNISGTFQREASFEYEVCLKCHGITEDRDPIVYRDDNVTNARLEFAPQNMSFHPVADVGRNPTIVGLISPLTPASRTPCTACHNNDAGSLLGATAPRGPHGSNYRPILAAEYRVDASPGLENYQLYALCYGCHDRNTVLDRSGGFPHRLHVVDVGASCAVCHDAHGSRNNQHLINFMTRDLTGEPVVTPSSSGTLQYDSLGTGAGRCFLTCHGSDHNPKEYSVAARGGGAIVPLPLRRDRSR